MNKLTTRTARVDRLARAWLESLRRYGFGAQAERIGQRLARALSRLDRLATNGPAAREAVLASRLRLHSVLEQVEGMQQAAERITA